MGWGLRFQLDVTRNESGIAEMQEATSVNFLIRFCRVLSCPFTFTLPVSSRSYRYWMIWNSLSHQIEQVRSQNQIQWQWILIKVTWWCAFEIFKNCRYHIIIWLVVVSVSWFVSFFVSGAIIVRHPVTLAAFSIQFQHCHLLKDLMHRHRVETYRMSLFHNVWGDCDEILASTFLDRSIIRSFDQSITLRLESFHVNQEDGNPPVARFFCPHDKKL